jgi:hypothetical protein
MASTYFLPFIVAEMKFSVVCYYFFKADEVVESLGIYGD